VILSVFGFNFRTASLVDREPFQLQRRDLSDAVLSYKRINNVDEVLILATCNRVEFYRVNASKDDHGQEVIEFYRKRGLEDPTRISEISYKHVGAGAVRHLFRVISGMDSLIIGEEQIRGQVKDAYSAACSVGGPGKYLHKLMHYAFRVSKKTRNESDISNGIRSIPGAAVSTIVPEENSGLEAVVIGANETSEVVLSHLVRKNVKTTLVNRTFYTAEKMAKAYNVSVAKIEDLSEVISRSDLIFSATGSPEFVVTPELIKDRSSRELTIADLAVPRDIDPEIAKKGNVILKDLEDLKYDLEKIMSKRSDSLPKAQGIIEEQVDFFLKWMHSQEFAGGVETLKSELHDIADKEIERYRGSFRKSDGKALDALAHGIIKRFLKVATNHFESSGIQPGEVERCDPANKQECKKNGSKSGEPCKKEGKLTCRERRALREGNSNGSEIS
jgi:glutamyl-tRNA reductase